MASSSNKKYVADNERLMAEWNWDKNNELGLNPKELTCGSNKKVWWLGKCGHEWKATVKGRKGCPYCAQESQTSFPEQVIYFYCKKYTSAINRYTGLGKEIDVYLPEHKTGIEYNGKYWHKDKEQQDKNKVKYFADKGIRIITVKEGDKFFIEGDVIECIYGKTHLNLVIKSIFDLIGIKCEDVDIDRDTIKILEQYIETKKENSIAIKRPKSIKEWNYEKNGKLLPTMVSYGSSKKVWWKCEKCGYEWKTTINNYAKSNCCKKCSDNIKKQVLCIETGVVYESVSQAKKQTGITNISYVCNGKYKTAGGYHWEFVDEDKKNMANKFAKNRINKKNKPVCCIEMDIVYCSAAEAENKTGINRRTIGHVCRGIQKTAGGYHWEFVAESVQ